MEDDLAKAIESLTREVNRLSGRIADLERTLLSRSSAPPPAPQGLSEKLDRLTQEVKGIRREMF